MIFCLRVSHQKPSHDPVFLPVASARAASRARPLLQTQTLRPPQKNKPDHGVGLSRLALRNRRADRIVRPHVQSLATSQSLFAGMRPPKHRTAQAQSRQRWTMHRSPFGAADPRGIRPRPTKGFFRRKPVGIFVTVVHLCMGHRRNRAYSRTRAL